MYINTVYYYMWCARDMACACCLTILPALFISYFVFITGEDAPRQRGEMSATLASAFPNLRRVRRRQLIFGYHFAKFGTAKSFPASGFRYYYDNFFLLHERVFKPNNIPRLYLYYKTSTATVTAIIQNRLRFIGTAHHPYI